MLLRLTRLCVLVLTLGIISSVDAQNSAPDARPSSRTCKCMPGDACYPTSQQWDQFSSRLSRPLVRDQRPLGAVCFRDSGEFNYRACSYRTRRINDPIYRAGLSNAAQFTTFEALVNGTTVQQCDFSGPMANGTCFQGRVPPNAVNVTNAADVQEAVRFASRHNLRLIVRNSGHELMGRSMGVGALEVFTHNLQKIEFTDHFVPEGAPPQTQGEYAVTMGSGVSWNTAYAQADIHNRSLPGGLSPYGTVGAAGGWVLGGGHSALSRYYGLGVDNVLQMKVVLPNATYATVNKYRDPDLFWALRGGGGPSFGIVIEMTVRTHPNPPYTAMFWVGQAQDNASYTNLFELWNRYNNPLNEAGWSGVMPFFNRTIFLTMLAQGNPPYDPQAMPLMQSFHQAARYMPGVTVLTEQFVPYRSFGDFNYDNLVNTTVPHGFNFTASLPGPPHSVTSSWLLPWNITAPENARPLAKIYTNLPGGTHYMVGGGPVSTNDPSEVSITPAWRNITTSLIILPTGILGIDDPTSSLEAIRRSSYEQTQVFRELAPPPFGGQYLNEGDYYEENWQAAYWGPNYPRLLAVKRRIDPKDLLIVRKGVNSEDWDEEIICKTPSSQ
ncbi:hypothetical protein D9613_010701 [Agrocybe pediades]|uniref:FAD-binding PCMH-type domain-containing protein n=1 Tax=Agrocybe pediades TaxID=84607 RepID=A0A8H4QLH0_9AGAR|nr:hypothetical protein D9613_010701 [Agrocybe pediades]